MQNNQPNFWESELRKMFQNSAVLEDFRVMGRTAMGRISDMETVKLKFVRLGTAEHYEAIEATVLNRTEGVIDRTTLRFEDIIGKVEVANANGNRTEMTPYIWDRSGGAEWFRYKPTVEDYLRMCDTVDSYLEMFQEPAQLQGMRQM